MPTDKNKKTQPPLTWQDAPDPMTTGQAARVVGRHVNSIRKGIKAGYLATTQSAAGRHMIGKSALAAYAGIAQPGNERPAADVLSDYADRLQGALDLPAGQMLAAIQGIVEDMREEPPK